jgi:GGDEF domain-containing protein
LISILKSATELDRLENLLQAVTECYMLTLRSVSQYTPEIDPHQTTEFRSHIKNLEEQWRTARSAEGFHAVQTSLRSQLRENRDQAREQLVRLRKELEGAAAAMTSFAEGIASNGADCDDGLKRELKRLEKISSSSDLLEIRGGIQTAVGEIATNVEQMRRGNQLIVAQLQDEIRLLHQEFQAERRALYTDPSSGAWTRQKLDLKINEKLRQDDRFCVISVAIRNFPGVKADYSATVLESTLKAMLMRFRGTVGQDALIGRWTDEQFVVILDVDPTGISEIAAGLAKALGGPYVAQENGIARQVVLDVATNGLERAIGSDPASFIRRLDQVSRSILRPTSQSLA